MVSVLLDRIERCGTAAFDDGAVYEFKVSRAMFRGFNVHSLFNVGEDRPAVNPSRGRLIERAIEATCGRDPV